MKKIAVLLIGVAVVFAFCFAKPCYAFLYSEKIKSFDVEIIIREDSSFLVKESIWYDFGVNPKHGIFRDIPKKGIEIKLLEITDEFGNPYPYKKSSWGKDVSIKIGDPDRTIKGVHCYNISYEVRRALGFFDDHDELYWNVTGNKWQVPIKTSSAKIVLPQQISQADLKLDCFTGTLGSKGKQCFYKQERPQEIYFEAYSLAPRAGLTIVLGMPKGIVLEPSPLEKVVWFLIDNWTFLLPIFVFIFLFREWWQKGRDFPLKKPIIAQYEPPDNLGPAEVGTIIKQKVENRSLSAIIVDLAIRGYIKIKEEEKPLLFVYKTKMYSFVKQKDFSKDESLRDYEKKLLQAIFGHKGKKDIVQLDSLKESFYSHINPIKKDIYKGLSSEKYFISRPDRATSRMIGRAIIFWMLSFLVLYFGDVSSFLLFGLPLIISGFLFLIFAPFMPKRTRKGAEAYWKALGLKEYINTAERYRVKFQEQENIFEKILPYAIIFGIADKWAGAFEGIYTQPPSWYEGSFGTHFSAAVFAHSLDSSLSSMTSAFVSKPGGGGCGGGGFSGGGGGGGGGGSW